MIHFDNGFALYTHAEREISEDEEQAILKTTWPSFVMEDAIAKPLFSRLYSDFPLTGSECTTRMGGWQPSVTVCSLLGIVPPMHCRIKVGIGW